MLDLELKPVLVVDDDEAFAAAVSRWLIELGYEVTHVGTVSSAVRALNEPKEYVFILLDLELPEISGLTLLRRLNREPTSPPVIVTSGTANVDEVIRVWREQAADFLRKPFSIDELSGAIERALGPEPEDTNQADCGVDADPPTYPGYADPPPDTGPSTITEGDSSRTFSPPSHEVSGKRIRPIVARLREAVSNGTLSIPVMNPSAGNLQQFLTGSEFTIQDVATEIGRDTGLTLGVLRIANSAQYARGAPVTSVLDACSRLGATRVVGLALEVAVREHFTLGEEPFHGIMSNLWRNAAVTARLSENLARALGRPDAEELYVVGLLHNLGEIICVKLYAEMNSAGLPVPPLDRMNREVAKIHEQIGGIVAASWKLPKRLISLIGHHHHPAESPEDPELRRLRLIILSAWALAVEHGYAYWPHHPGGVSDRYLAALGIDDATVENLTAPIHSWRI